MIAAHFTSCENYTNGHYLVSQGNTSIVLIMSSEPNQVEAVDQNMPNQNIPSNTDM